MKHSALAYSARTAQRSSGRSDLRRYGVDGKVGGAETLEDIYKVLSPEQLVVVALRLDGLNMQESADELEISRNAVADRLRTARLVVARALPELWLEIGDRKRARVYNRCAECGELITSRSTWCRVCAPKDNRSPLQKREVVL